MKIEVKGERTPDTVVPVRQGPKTCLSQIQSYEEILFPPGCNKMIRIESIQPPEL